MEPVGAAPSPLEDMVIDALDSSDLALAESGLAAYARCGPEARALLRAVKVLRSGEPLWRACAALDGVGSGGARITVALADLIGGRLERNGSAEALALAYRLYEQVVYHDDAQRLVARRARLSRRIGDVEQVSAQAAALLVSRLDWMLHETPDDLDALVAIARIARSNDPGVAGAAITRALALAPTDPAVVTVALRAFIEDEPARAIAIAHEYGVAHPDDASIYLVLGDRARRHDLVDEALDAYRCAAERGARRAACELIELAMDADRWASYAEADRARWTALAEEPDTTAASAPLPESEPLPPAEPAPAAGAIVKATYALRGGAALEAGTGFVVQLAPDGTALLVTAQHVFGPPGRHPREIPPADMPDEVTGAHLVDAFDGEPVATAGRALRVPYASHEAFADLAALPIAELGRARALALAPEPPLHGDPVWLAARLRGGAPPGRRVHRGEVQSFLGEPLEVKLDEADLVLFGASGAPFLDAYGRVVGVLVRFSNDDDQLVGRGLALAMLRGMLGDALDPDAAKEPTMHRRFSMSLHIQTVASLTEAQAAALLAAQDLDTGAQVRFLASDSLRARLTYPLEHPFEIDIPSDPQRSIGHVLWRIAQAYQQVYAQPERHGVWGHEIEKLYLERIEIADGDVTIGVRS